VIVEAHPPPPDVNDADDDGAAAAMQMDFPRPSRNGNDDDDDGRAAEYVSAVAAPAPVRFVAHRALLGARSRLLRSMMAWQQQQAQQPATAADSGSGSNDGSGDGAGPGAAVLSLHDAPAAAFASLLAYLYGDALQVHIQATI